MAFEDIDRRRFLLVGLLTLIVLPVVYFYSQSDRSADVVADDPTEIEESDGGGTSVPTDEVGPNRPPIELSDEDPTFLDGPATEVNPGVNEIAVPAQPETPRLELTASFDRNVAGPSSCYVRDVDSGITVTVRNLDNARFVECVSATPPEPQVADVVLHTDAFLRLADPTEAPIKVELTQ